MNGFQPILTAAPNVAGNPSTFCHGHASYGTTTTTSLSDMIHPRTFFVPILMLVVLMVGTSNVRGQELINQEPEIKAKLVALQRRLWTWPSAATPAAGAPFKIGILGNDPFQLGQINYLDQRLAAEKNVLVLRLANVNAYEPCHILVVSQAEDLQPALERTQGESVLIIAQSPGLAKQGAVMNLPVVQNRVKMEINLGAAKKAGLTPNPGLLRSAEIIR